MSTATPPPPRQAVTRTIKRQPESVPVAAALVGLGGFLDAYTFLLHRVFANAQSGNLVFLAVDAAQVNWSGMPQRLAAVGAYLVGLLVAHSLSTQPAWRVLRRPARWLLVIEIAVLTVLGFVPSDVPAMTVVIPVSFVAALQATAFSTVRGIGYNTTMATGNMRSLVAAAFTAALDRDDDSLRRTRVLVVIVAAFGIGAFAGAVSTNMFAERAAWVAAAVLAWVLGTLVLQARRRGRSD